MSESDLVNYFIPKDIIKYILDIKWNMFITTIQFVCYYIFMVVNFEALCAGYR
jgi:hypothetical protein